MIKTINIITNFYEIPTMKKKIPPLALEISQTRSNILYLSLIEHKRENYLGIIDNISDTEVSAYILDYAKQQGISISWLLSIANIWYYKSSGKSPFSYELSRLGLTEKVQGILRTYDVNNVVRIKGMPFTFDIDHRPKVRRRRVVPIPQGVEIILRKTPT